jgi:hypothetical protein
MRLDFETAQQRYEEQSLTQRDKPCPLGRNYDFYRLLDGVFNVKSMSVVLVEKNLSVGRSVKHDLFRFVVICSRHIDERVKPQEYGENFSECWILFRSIVEKMYSAGECWSNELASSTVRLLFIAAVMFNLPDNCILENVISNPDARRVPGSYRADVEDIEFSKTLPCDLNGSFQTESALFNALKGNLRLCVDKIER